MSLREQAPAKGKNKKSPLPLAGEGGCRRQPGEGGLKLEGHALSWPENNDNSAGVENVNAKNESEAVGGRTVGRGNPRFFGGRDGARPSN